ncbi:4-amino-4-deoxy-L-arabinose transferase [Rickettsiales bacterium Ac37b]|nr:4-amino-4-deoxy-L-arabinose transferase [Rickettsiales bacterium Ac37b]
MYNLKFLSFSPKFYNIVLNYILFIFLIIITLYRIHFLSINGFNLYADEAQYWDWSRNLFFGYYSKPPMIAWLIRLFTNVCGDTEFCIRLGSPIMHLLTSFVLIAISYKLYQNLLLSLITAIIYITLPAVTLSSALITTDTLLLFFWALGVYFFLCILEDTKNIGYWTLAAISIGLGCLSKYNMIIFLPSGLLYILWSRQHSLKQFLFNYRTWYGLIIVFLIYLPNLLWNFNNHFVSYQHTKEISNLHRSLFHPEKLLEFWGAQIIIFGPIMVYLFIRSLRALREEKKILLSFIIPFFLIISILSLLSGAFANWAAPIYITATVQATAFAFYSTKRHLLIYSLILHLLTAMIFYNYHDLAKFFNVKLAANGQVLTRDPFKKLKGWKELGESITKLKLAYPQTSLLVDDRKLLVELNYYVKSYPVDIYKWNYFTAIRDHYDLTKKVDYNLLGKNFLFITSNQDINSLKGYFNSILYISTISINLYKNYSLTYYVYYLEHLIKVP